MTVRKYSRQVEGKATVRREQVDGKEKTYIDCYPVVFNQRSKLIREWGEIFYEVIAPNALDAVLKDPGINTIHTVDHMRHKMLGRTKSGTLQLAADSYGLKASVEMPNTTLGRDMVEMIERGDYYECSFIFTIADKGVEYDRSKDIPVRTVTNIQDLYDTSFVIDGAYANTNIKARFASEYETPEFNPLIHQSINSEADELAKARMDILQKEIEILKLQ